MTRDRLPSGIFRTWPGMRALLAREKRDVELPLRSQLFNADQLEQHGAALAGSHELREGRGPDQLLDRLDDNERMVLDTVALLARADGANRRLTPAGEWLLDNHHLVDEQIRTARRHLPRRFSRELPQLANGPCAGLPRVYDIAQEAIAHGDGRIDGESLLRFVLAYERVTPLALGELWAVPIMLRLALVENLRRVCSRLRADRVHANVADAWADRMIAIAEADPKSVVLATADMARSEPPLSSAFVAELARRLHGRSAALAAPLGWIEHWLGESGLTLEEMVHAEHQQQAADQLSVSNSFGSLRLLAKEDWRRFVESASLVERALRADPDGTYPRMDFATRDLYRHAAERISRRTDLGGMAAAEIAVAEKAVALAREAKERGEEVAGHVGYWLVDEGRPALEAAAGMRVPLGTRATRALGPLRTPLFVGTIAIVTVALTAVLLQVGALPLAAALPLAFVASEIAVALLNWAATQEGPRSLPRMELDRVPPELRTLVVVPTMIRTPAEVDALLEALEVRFLANRDPSLHFALLTDFYDAGAEHVDGDDELLAHARSAVERLQRKYADQPGAFALLHRPRRWNEREGAWMGWERKRGKLADLDALLRGRGRDRFTLVVGDEQVLRGVRFVLTLDRDTGLPRNVARELVGTFAHPLVRPRLDDGRCRVTRGYGILQPRVGASLAATATPYARLFGTEPGIDPYTRAVSDVYQDVFSEGSFVGKGIYDVDTFDAVVGELLGENRILSHDLLEGCCARAALVSDVALYEEHPTRYLADARRRHRWIRGDWQLLPWLLPSVWHPRQGRIANPLSGLSRWKLADNLRRSLVPISILALLVAALGAGLPLHALGLLLLLLVPTALGVVTMLVRAPEEIALHAHLRETGRTAARALARFALVLAALPHEAAYTLDAILRTLWRLVVSRRHLLQWSSSHEIEGALGDELPGWFRAMAAGPLLGLALVGATAFLRPEALPLAVPFALLWTASPALMGWASRPIRRRVEQLDDDDVRLLRVLARRTWGFFETWVGPDDHWLPPDNVQEEPSLVVAHRTSPTNVGLSLVSALAAHDLGHLATGRLLERVGGTLRTVLGLEKCRGHLYNWYDTVSLTPLRPRFLSSVDSGNLVGHLLVLRQGLLALLDAPVLPPRAFEGLHDTLEVLREVDPDAPCAALAARVDELRRWPPTTVAAAAEALTGVASAAEVLAGQLAPGCEARAWAEALAGTARDLASDLEAYGPVAHTTIPTLRALADEGNPAARARRERLEALAADADALATGTDFTFLYDPARRLLSIGWNVEDRRLDAGCYDLLASESRLATYVAISLGQIPQESWFALGRQHTLVGGDPVLLSWSGSMFEYLMPRLVMPTYDGTLLDRTERACVTRQVDYGEQRGVPWGVSESGYATVDAHSNYQYRAFGVPGLGLKRGLADDLVVSPYSSLMAVAVAPRTAAKNLRRLLAEGAGGRFGLYEAIDFTPARLRPGRDRVLLRSFMAHHQGMSLLGLSATLLGEPMQRRFAADPRLRASELLLQERVPRAAPFHPHPEEVEGATLPSPEVHELPLRIVRVPDPQLPALQLLSNGRYHVMVGANGAGSSRLRDVLATRWREDGTRDPWGFFVYLRDASGDVWSVAHLPTRAPLEGGHAIFSDSKVEFRGQRNAFETHLEISVSPEDDVELRRLHVTNRARGRRVLELTTYAEVVIAPLAADEAHPAFGNLFVQTELLRERQAIVCTRRPRSASERAPVLFHRVAVHDAGLEDVSFETDRLRFLGRANDPSRPRALAKGAPARLSEGAGSVLDPIVAIRVRIVLDPDRTAVVDLALGMGADRAHCDALVDKYGDRRLADRVFDLAWTHAEVLRRQVHASPSEAQLYERLAGLVVHPHPAFRAEPSVLLQNRRDQQGLWGQGIGGDLPIVVVHATDPENPLVEQVVRAHAYWRLKGLAVDLVVVVEEAGGYRQALHDRVMGLVAGGIEATAIDRAGGVHVRPQARLSPDDRVLLEAAARVVLYDTRGPLGEQLDRKPPPIPKVPALAPSTPWIERRGAVRRERPRADGPYDDGEDGTLLANGLGGFSSDGREYVVTLEPGRNTPAPWSNVIANDRAGTVLTESGLGYSWVENAHEWRLSPWVDDPVSDLPGKVLWLRDDESGAAWSLTPQPTRGMGTYRIRHGFGYSVYETDESGVASQLWVFVHPELPLEYWVLRLRNASGRARRLSATAFVEWVLGERRSRTHLHVVTELDAATGALLARNRFSIEFGRNVAFLAVDDPRRTVSGDRREVIGRNASLAEPAWTRAARLSGRVGPGLDPCGAVQVEVALRDGEERELVFGLGGGADAAEAVATARAVSSQAARGALAAVREAWRRHLGVVRVRTPEPAIDVLANGWLLYQAIASRFLGRSGFYQSGGAFGFRDQLQDGMAMVHAAPDLARRHLLRAAAQQFLEGDVLHWWHPPSGRGVRTRCSDDLVWLPLAVARHVAVRGDAAVLDEPVPYVEGRALQADEESYYDLPARSAVVEPLYDHCVRALRLVLARRGERGLPLMGSGDWNDGMNLVGIHGKGESVWLGFFLVHVLDEFRPLAAARGDEAFARECADAVRALTAALEEHAWDGEWYRRAWFDDGRALGSKDAPECQIDSIAQSWAVLSRAASPERARRAMRSLDERLVRRDAGLVQLLDPPFDQSDLDPGYIRGYVPGVRENGGQYTHAAVWAAMAFAELGEAGRAWELARMILPVNHARTLAEVGTYRVEPYVIAADVYAVPPHTGRGGWTWYTGSAGWTYRLLVESLLGLRILPDRFAVAPLLPEGWDGFELEVRLGGGTFRVVVRRGEPGVTLDGEPRPDGTIPIGAGEHEVRVQIR